MVTARAEPGAEPGCGHAGYPSDERLDREELRFMEDLVDLLEACHFRLLSVEDWQTAQAEEFTVRQPFPAVQHTADVRAYGSAIRDACTAGRLLQTGLQHWYRIARQGSATP